MKGGFNPNSKVQLLPFRTSPRILNRLKLARRKAIVSMAFQTLKITRRFKFVVINDLKSENLLTKELPPAARHDSNRNRQLHDKSLPSSEQ